MSHLFPMVRGGGLFILIMGISVVSGGLFSAQRKLLLALGGGAATAAIVLFGNTLTRQSGVPTTAQIIALYGSIVFEVLLIGIISARYRRGSERTYLLAILFVVGVHFVPMAIAFGPWCAVLGIAAAANAGVGLWMRRKAPLNLFWLIDGIAKLIFGGLMFSVAAPWRLA